MIVAVRTEGTRAILLLSGELTLKAPAEDLRKEINRLLQQGFSEFVLDLNNVSYVDSAGLGELVQAYVTVKNGGGRLQLANLPRRVSDWLSVASKLIERSDSDTSREFAGDPLDLDPLDPHFPRFGGNPAKWLAVWVALVILALVIATLAGFRSL